MISLTVTKEMPDGSLVPVMQPIVYVQEGEPAHLEVIEEAHERTSGGGRIIVVRTNGVPTAIVDLDIGFGPDKTPSFKLKQSVSLGVEAEKQSIGIGPPHH